MPLNLQAQTSPLTAIAFDLGNVLIRVDHGRFCRRLARVAGVAPEAVHRAVFEGSLEPDYDTGRLSSRAFYQEVMSFFQVDLPYPCFCAWWQDIFDPMEEMTEVVEALAGRYPLFLLSNTNDLHFPFIYQRFPLVRRVTRYILSYQVGSRKPEAGIYQSLIRELPGPPEQCLFVDDKAPFVEAARTHGFMAWQFTTPQDFIARLQQNGLYEPE